MSALPAEPLVDTAPESFDMRDYFDGIAGFLAGPANVILQLGRPAVGHGVVEKSHPDGDVMRHPFKRLRTTFSYLTVAALGNDDDRAAMREAVNGSHRGVRSDPGSPVRFNAFDPELQLWVAACIAYGFADAVTRLHGPMDDAEADALYAASIRFGTTLQMPPSLWPATRAEFEAYWEGSLTAVRFDPAVRDYLLELLRFQQLHPLMRLGAGRFMTWTNTGFLPPVFREQLGLTWTATDERAFATVMRGVGFGYRLMPRVARNFPFNYLLWDVRRRVRAGRPIV